MQPAPPEVADDWSLVDFTADEIEKQRRLFAELERQRAAAPPTATRRPRIPPPPQQRPLEYIKLDATDSEDEDEAAFRRTLLASKWHSDDDDAVKGQGCRLERG